MKFSTTTLALFAALVSAEFDPSKPFGLQAIRSGSDIQYASLSVVNSGLYISNQGSFFQLQDDSIATAAGQKLDFNNQGLVKTGDSGSKVKINPDFSVEIDGDKTVTACPYQLGKSVEVDSDCKDGTEFKLRAVQQGSGGDGDQSGDSSSTQSGDSQTQSGDSSASQTDSSSQTQPPQSSATGSSDSSDTSGSSSDGSGSPSDGSSGSGTGSGALAGVGAGSGSGSDSGTSGSGSDAGNQSNGSGTSGTGSGDSGTGSGDSSTGTSATDSSPSLTHPCAMCPGWNGQLPQSGGSGNQGNSSASNGSAGSGSAGSTNGTISTGDTPPVQANSGNIKSTASGLVAVTLALSLLF